MTSDWQELGRYAVDRSDEAFAELVNRHIRLVYSAAFRQTGDEQLAKDITQMVFANLARRAKWLKPKGALAGWLHRDTRLTALSLMRQDRRRAAREREAFRLKESNGGESTDWRQIRPELDAALDQLGRVDRDALLLRFFEERSLKEVGAALKMEEDAARKRIARAIEKLREILSRRGIHASGQMLSSSLSAQAAHAVPAGLAALVASSSVAAAGSAVGSLTTFAFIEGVAMTKLKASVAAVIIAAGVSVPLLVQRSELKAMRSENSVLRTQAEQAIQLQAENDRLSRRIQDPGRNLDRDEFAELMRLRGEIGLLRQQTNELGAALAKATEGSRDPTRQNAVAQEEPVMDLESAKAVIFDPNADLVAKLEALRVLRRMSARSDDVVRQMVSVYYSTTNPDARADIFRQLHGMTLPELKRPLLEAVSNPNEFPKVKEEAAETLEGYLTDANVRAWLEHLAKNDENEAVRVQASETLARQ